MPVGQADEGKQRGHGHCVDREGATAPHATNERANTITFDGATRSALDAPTPDQEVLGCMRSDIGDEARGGVDSEHYEEQRRRSEVDEPRCAVDVSTPFVEAGPGGEDGCNGDRDRYEHRAEGVCCGQGVNRRGGSSAQADVARQLTKVGAGEGDQNRDR
jgi:hypothetical protein